MTPRLTESPFRVGPALALSVFALTSASFLLSCAEPTAAPDTDTNAGTGNEGSGEHDSTDAACHLPETAHPGCMAEGLRGAEDCPGSVLDPTEDGSHFCLPVPPAPPAPPAPAAPAFHADPEVGEACPESAGGRCNRAVPCAPTGERFPEESALRAFFGESESVAVLYVDPAGQDDGDGSRQRPWRSLADHASHLPNRAILALAPGVLEGALVVESPLRILGACDGATTLRGADSDDILVTVDANDVELVSLVLEPRLHGVLAAGVSGLVLQQIDLRSVTGRGVNAELAAELWMEDIRITGRPGARRPVALFAHNARVDGQRVHVRGWWQSAVNAQVTAHITLRDLTIDGTSEAGSDMYGLWASRQTRIEVTRVRAINAGSAFGVVDGRADAAEPVLIVRDLAMESLAPTGDGPGWRRHGFIVVGRGTLELERVHAEPLEALFLTLEEDASAVIRDVNLESIRGFDALRSFNVPFQLLDRSRLDAARLRVGSAEAYVLGLQHEAAAEVADMTVEGVMPDAAGAGPGRPVTLAGTGAFSLRRADLRFGGDNGLVLTGPDITLEDVAVRPAEQREAGRAQRGLIVQSGDQVTLRRVHTIATSAGIALLDITGTMTGEDIVIEDHHPLPGSPANYNVGGLRLESVQSFALSRVALINSAWPAAQAGLSDGTLRDVWIGSAAPDEPSVARGLIVHDGEVTVERLMARNVQGYAVLSYGDAARVALHDAVVIGSRVGLCDDASCNVDGCSVSVEGGAVELGRFWLEDADLGALCLRDGGTVSARHGMLVRNRNGVVLDGAQVDLDRDFEDVVLLENTRGVVSDQVVRSGTPDTSSLVP